MRVALDSSAMAKRHIQEAGTERVFQWLAEADEVFLSVLVFPEIVSALNRRRREGRLPRRQYQVHMQELRDDTRSACIVDLGAAVMRRAVACLEEAPLRASDAIHIATAQEVNADVFISADRRQCEAARAVGLRVEEIAAGG